MSSQEYNDGLIEFGEGGDAFPDFSSFLYCIEEAYTIYIIFLIMNGVLYIIGTPIGNLEDITLRALSILKSVDGILCEDTRVTKKLLERYEIAMPVMSYPADWPRAGSNNAKHARLLEKIIGMLGEGKSLALVSDAGTPTISDPGARLVAEVRSVSPETKVIPIPGASAIITALSMSGFPADQFLFLGFLPHKKGRETLFKEIANEKRTVVLYESPHRLGKTLKALEKHLAAPGLPAGRQIAVARELTKMFESFKIGTARELADYFSAHTDEVRGEIVILVSGS